MQNTLHKFPPMVLLFLAAVSAHSFGCNNDPAEGKVKAKLEAPVTVSGAADKEGAKYSFSAGNSKLEFVGAKVTNKHDGSFSEFSGTITLPSGDPQKGTVVVDVATASVVVDPPKLSTHLKSADFFDVERFPKAQFTSTSVGPGEGGQHTVTGNLELHGVTKSITFPATIQVGSDRVTVVAEFAINRKDFGIVYAGMADDLIKDHVLIRLNLNAARS